MFNNSNISEDCIDKIPNRYELLMVAAQRAKDISSGSPLTVDRDNDKNSVVALREIAEETVSIEELQRSLVMGLQKFVEVEEPEEEELEIMAAERELADLDEQFSGLLPQMELEDSMQIHSGCFNVAHLLRMLTVFHSHGSNNECSYCKRLYSCRAISKAYSFDSILDSRDLGTVFQKVLTDIKCST